MSEPEVRDVDGGEFHVESILAGAPTGGEVYRHYLGWECRVVTVALTTRSFLPLVVYQGTRSNVVWAATLHHFRETVEIQGRSVPRFTRVDP